MNDIQEIIRVNIISVLTFVISIMGDLSVVLTVLVLLSTLIFNLIKIYQALKRRSDKKNGVV